ncbi:MAG: GNAT family N-acetyltransferase [Acidimicrobiales bacterium]
MTIVYRQPVTEDIPAMAELGSRCQADPSFHIAYLGLDAAAIATDIGELDGWTETSTVAVEDQQVIGWLVGEIDLDMGRLWWWGPFATADDRWAEIADMLYTETRRRLPSAITEEEACADDRSDAVRRWCDRHRLEANTASVLLQRPPTPAVVDPRIRPLADGDHQAVGVLHDLAFPGTHTTAAALVESDHPRLLIELDGRVVGYVAFELQSDGSGYIDYLAVDDAHRGAGLGRALVDHACHDMFAAGATYAHLTVREDNPAARALYSRLGFVEERLARPYRLGFDLG